MRGCTFSGASMSAASFSQLVLLYTWFALAALIALMLVIARFYQHFSGEPMAYRLFLLPMLLFGIASVRYASIDRIGGDLLGDVLAGAAGALLAACAIHLYHRMTINRPEL
jgi:hypothetical protein